MSRKRKPTHWIPVTVAVLLLTAIILIGIVHEKAFGGTAPTNPNYDARKYTLYAKTSGVRGDSVDCTTPFKAMLARISEGWTVVLDSGKTYLLTDSVTIPSGVTVEFRGSYIYIEGGLTKPGMVLSDNVTLINPNIVYYSNAAAWSTEHGGLGTAITVGNYMSGTGAKNIRILGGSIKTMRKGGNSILITGQSYNITIDGTVFLKNDSANYDILLHWGGATTPASGTYHPHNILLQNLVIDSMRADSGHAIGLRGVYGVAINNVESYRSAVFVSIGAGDYGFYYADANVYGDTFSGGPVMISNCISHKDSIGVLINGATSSVPVEYPVPTILDNVHTYGYFAGAGSTKGFYIINDVENVVLRGCKSQGYDYGVSFGARVRGVAMHDCLFRNNKQNGAVISYVTGPPTDIFFDRCWFDSANGGAYVGGVGRVSFNACTFDRNHYAVRMTQVPNTAIVSMTNNYVASSQNSANAGFLLIDTIQDNSGIPFSFFNNKTFSDTVELVTPNSTIPYDSLFAFDSLYVGRPNHLVITGGTIGQMLTTDGSGGLSWTTPPGAGSGDDVSVDSGDASYDVTNPVFTTNADVDWQISGAVVTLDVLLSDSAIGAERATIADSAIGADTADYAKNALKADSALKATQDANGDAIRTSYLHSAGDTMTGELDMNNSNIRRVAEIYGDSAVAIPYWQITWIYDVLNASYKVSAVLLDATDSLSLSTDGTYRSLLGWGIKKDATTLIMQCDTTELDAGMATDAEMTTHTGTASAHHTRPSAGTGMTEVANAFNVDLGTAITTGEITDSNVTGIKIASAVWDSIRVGYTGGSSAWTLISADSLARIFAVGDTLWMYADTVNDSIHIWASHGNLILGSASLSVFDSVQVYNLIRWGSGADTCTINYAVIDSIYHQLGRFAAGSGDITGVTAGVLITGGGTSGTVTINADTGIQSGAAGLATKPFVRDSGTGLDFTTETDSGVWSVFAPIAPNTGVKLSGSVIVGDSGMTTITDLTYGHGPAVYKFSTVIPTNGYVLKFKDSTGTAGDSTYWAADETGGVLNDSVLGVNEGDARYLTLGDTANQLRSNRDDTTTNNLYVKDLYLKDLSSGTPGLYFYDNDPALYTRAFIWDTADDRFELNDSLWIDGNLIITGTVDTVDVAALADSYWGHDHSGVYEPADADLVTDAILGDTLNTYFDSTAAVARFLGKAAADSTSYHVGFKVGLNVKNGATSGGYIDFFEDSDFGTNYIRLGIRTTDLAANWTPKLPASNNILLPGPGTGTTGIIARLTDSTTINRSIGPAAGIDISVTNAAGVTGNPTIAFSRSATLAGNPALTTNQVTFGTNGIIWEGATADEYEGLLTCVDIATSDKTWTLPNATGTICLTGDLSGIIDTLTTAKIPVSDSCDGGAARAELADDVDTLDGGIAAALADRADKSAQDSTESWTDTIPSVATGLDTTWGAFQTYVTNHAGVDGIWAPLDSGAALFKADTILEIKALNAITQILPGQNTTLVIGDTTGPTLIDSATIGGQYIDHADSILSKVEADATYEPVNANLVTDAILEDSLNSYFDTTATRSAFLSKVGGTMTGEAAGDWYRSDTTDATDRLITTAEVSSMINDSGLNLSGELSVKGGIYVSNQTYKLDYTNVWAQQADSIVRDIPIVYIDTALMDDVEEDSISVVHLGIARHDLGWYGSTWKNFVTYTPYPHSPNASNENIHVAYFNDDFHWTNVFDSTTWDSVTNPIFRKADWAECDFVNDPDAYPDENGDIRIQFNLAYTNDSDVCKSVHSANGYDWGDTSNAITITNEPCRQNWKFTPTLALDEYTYFDSMVIKNNSTYDTIELVSWTAPVSATTIAMVCDSMVKYINLSSCSLYVTAVDFDSFFTLKSTDGIGIVNIDVLDIDTNTADALEKRVFNMSPSPLYLYGQYHRWSVWGYVVPGADSTRVRHEVSDYADSGWAIKDSICHGLQPADSSVGGGSAYIWHLEVTSRPGELVAFALVREGTSFDKEVISVSYDTGSTWTMYDTIGSKYAVIHEDSTGADSVGVYRGSGYWVDNAHESYFRFFYPGNDFWESPPKSRWNICVTNVHFYDNKKKFERTLWNPDLLTDTIPVFTVEANKYPYGIRIDEISCLTSVDGAYALKFMTFTSADPPVFHDWIDTLNVGASDQRVSSITFENHDASTLDAGQELYILTPATDIDWVKFWVRFHAKEKTW